MNKLTHYIVFLMLPFLGFITLMLVFSVLSPYWITLVLALGVLYYAGLLRSMSLLEGLYLDELIDRDARLMQLQFQVGMLLTEIENGGTYYEDDEPEDDEEWEDPFLPKDDDDTDYALPTVQHGSVRGYTITKITLDELAAEDGSNSGGFALSGNGQPGGDAPSEDLMQVPPGLEP